MHLINTKSDIIAIFWWSFFQKDPVKLPFRNWVSRKQSSHFLTQHKILSLKLLYLAIAYHFHPVSFYMKKVKVSHSVISNSLWPYGLYYIALQAPLSMEFSWQEYWSGLPFPSLGDLRNPGMEYASPALQADSLRSEPPVKTSFYISISKA